MVKRKAEISLDEWLDRTAIPSEAESADIPAAATNEGLESSMITEQRRPEVNEGLVTGIPAKRVPAEGESSEWFWTLLEQESYERW